MVERYEWALRRWGSHPGGLGARFADAADRLGGAPLDPHLRAVHEVGRWVAAPLLVSYVLWVLQDARERGLQRLYFLARDGQVLLAIAEQLADRVGFTGELRYLYGSRRSWTAEGGGAAATEGAPATGRLEAYLEQEGLFEAVPSGLVDIGWQGTLHEIAARLQAFRAAPVAHGYVFGSTRREGPWWSRLHAFAFDFGRERHRDILLSEFYDISTLCEVFAAADHGTVLGFEETGGRIVPRFAEGWDGPARAWGVPVLQAAMVGVATRLDLTGWTPGGPRAMARTAKEPLRLFWLRPTEAEARAWAAFPWDEGLGQATVLEPLAEPFTAADLARTGLLLRNRMRKRIRFWCHGALRLSPWHYRLLFGGLHQAARSLALTGQAWAKYRRTMAERTWLGDNAVGVSRSGDLRVSG